MNDVNAAEPGSKRRRLGVRDELLLALLPVGIVLPMIAVTELLGGHHLLCASLASSAFLIYLDPGHEMNGMRTLVVAQMAAAAVGWVAWLLLGGGYASAAGSIALAVFLMILLDAIHPPAVSTSLAFAMHLDRSSNVVLFALAVSIIALLVLLQRAVLRLLGSKT